MPIECPPLPYAAGDLKLFSEEQVAIHHGKHVAGYTKKVNAAIEGTADADKQLDEILASAEIGSKLANSAFQIKNHDWFFRSLAPQEKGGGGEPTGKIAEAINTSFGSFQAFKDKMSAVGAGHFGSGWAFLVQTASGLEVRDYHDAATPFRDADVTSVILALDLWEHSYYVDFRQDRPKYIETYWNLVNWSFANENLK